MFYTLIPMVNGVLKMVTGVVLVEAPIQMLVAGLKP